MCKRSEEKVDSVPSTRPEWSQKLHYSEGQSEYFVGISTQNDKLENGVALAVDNATNSITEAIGEVIKTKSHGVLTMESDDIRQIWGSTTSPTYLAHKEKTDIYYEKWIDYPDCKPHSFYNVWVLLKVPRSEFNGQAKVAEAYLKKIQLEEQAKKAESLIFPETRAQAVQQKTARAPVYTPPPPVKQAPVWDNAPAVPFACGSVAMYGGYAYIPSFNSEFGKQDGNTFNINFDGEFGLAKNICMGFGMAYLQTKREDGDEGHIVPMYLRVAIKGPLTSGHGLVGWIGGEMGAALLDGFNRADTWTNKQKTTGAFMVGPAGGIDLRIQKSVFLTIGAAYLPIFYHDTIQMVQTRGGIRYYF